jgi:hypothetical protein
MPFKKVGSNDYQSPSGRHFNGAQVRLYYANGGKFPGQKEDHVARSKGSGPQVASYAQGGPVVGRTKDFMKTPDSFRTDKQERSFEKSGKGASAPDKSLKAVKPQRS